MRASMLSRISCGSDGCLIKDIVLERTRPTEVFIDNQSARQLTMNPVHQQQSKHIHIKYHWIRDMIAFKAHSYIQTLHGVMW